MHSNDLRRRFLDYFAARGHTIVPSAPLVPSDDPTLLFTNAGMVPFKAVFTGASQRPYRRATSVQKCVRAGGKHNDLENVGYTARHHTFFEMLGNFSFGDYFKREAIELAWEFVTGRNHLAIDPRRLLVTVYAEDDEAYDLWRRRVGLPESRIVRVGDKHGVRYASDNFWSMGDTGPCGPCTEIFYDHDPDGRLGIPGGPPGSPDADGDRWVEIWNLVFMQYERQADGSMTPLPKPSVDTGMGLERIAAVMQGVHDNYRIDIFQHLIGAVAALAGQTAYANASQKVIADHIRAAVFLIADGVLPSNEGRGYVLRRIMRRAIRHGHKLGLIEPFFHKLAVPLAEIMGGAYPELNDKRALIENCIRTEEAGFAQTLGKGMQLLDSAITALRSKVIPGDVVFKLYDTYGFPVDLTADIARERGLSLDLEGYEREMGTQRERARSASNFVVGLSRGVSFDADCTFTGYEKLTDVGRVVGLIHDGVSVREVTDAQLQKHSVVVLDKTPFYAEGGGQVGDRGELAAIDNSAVFAVVNTLKQSGGQPGHIGFVSKGALRVGDEVRASVRESLRRTTMRNHSATHLMHRALREVLGEHVTQKGSLVDENRTRFDFSHNAPLTAGEIEEIEGRVNRAVLANVPVTAAVMQYDDAIRAGAMALFGEKYGDRVRVLRMGTPENNFSTELCGGTHVARTGDIGAFKIIAESGVAAGVRRVEAVTGEGVLSYLHEIENRLDEVAGRLRCGRAEVVDKLDAHLERIRLLDRELAALKQRIAATAGADLAARADTVCGTKVVAERVDGVDAAALRAMVDRLKQQLGSGVILLGSATADRVNLIAGVTQDLTARVAAGELVNVAAAEVGGRGGGRADMAQAGGSRPQALNAALEAARQWLAQRLAD
ncbi:MAG: alanine--tRNA ligase [Gammaproteobacteria bacterium]|nr:alanine--tRNA ligase [Gammaproteobacteria bacterium]